MYVGYAVLDNECYRFSTPKAHDDFLFTFPEAWSLSHEESEQFDVIRDGHEILK